MLEAASMLAAFVVAALVSFGPVFGNDGGASKAVSAASNKSSTMSKDTKNGLQTGIKVNSKKENGIPPSNSTDRAPGNRMANRVTAMVSALARQNQSGDGIGYGTSGLGPLPAESYQM